MAEVGIGPDNLAEVSLDALASVETSTSARDRRTRPAARLTWSKGLVTAMADQDSGNAEFKLLFSKEEWEAAMPKLTADMTAYLKQYRTPVFIDRGDHGEP